MSDTIVALEDVVRAAVPARDEVRVGDWVVRISGGSTKRVNSANPVAPGAALALVLDEAERLYRDAGLPSRFRLTPLAAPDADRALEDAGYARIDDSWTMTTPLGERTPDPAIVIDPAVSPSWLVGIATVLAWAPDEIAAHRAMLGRVADGGYAVLIEDGAPLAFGAVSLAHGRACLFDIATAPAARGRGLGRRVVEGLLGWAASRGCRAAVLQVLAENAPARRLYQAIGFVDAFPYHYRVRR